MEGIEEIAEYVAEEKLAQLKETVQVLAEWSEQFTARLKKIENKVNSNVSDVKTFDSSKKE